MGNQEIKIVFFGTPSFGAIILKKLIDNNYKPVLVITASVDSLVLKLAQKEGIEVKHDFNDIGNIDLIITASYGKIIPQRVLDLPQYGAINVHPSLLPKYRGSSPIQATILNGDKLTGTTLMLMDSEIDHGNIIAQVEYRLNKRNSYSVLDTQLANLSANLLIEILPKWLNDEIKTKEQDHSQATYTKIIKKKDGEINCAKGIEYIERQIRAYNPWPSAFTSYNGKMIKILEAEIENNELIIKKVQPAGKKPMDYLDFKRGNRNFKLC